MKFFGKLLIISSFAFFTMALSTNVFAAENYTVKTNGNASIEVEPDIATINIGVNTEESTADLALEKNSSIVNDITSYLKSIGISDDDYETANFYTYPKYKYNEDGTSTVIGNYVSNSIKVTIRDFDTISDIILNTTKLGANNISNVSFGLENDDIIYNQALQQAVKSAVNKGVAIGTSIGKTNLTVQSITETSYNRSTSILSGSAAGKAAVMENSIADAETTVPIAPETIEIYAEVEITME